MDARRIALTDRLEREGITVCEGDCDSWGYYDHRERVIMLRAGMTEAQKTATLFHEAQHYYRGDVGPQPSHVEDLINRQVADLLITPAAYEAAEYLADGSPAGIAAELGLPRWVVDAYRSVLRAA